MQRAFVRRHGPWLLTGLAAGAVALVPGLAPLLRYEREAVLAGEAWRLLTAHLVHLGPVHLGLNLVGLAFIGALFRRYWHAREMGGVMLLAALGTTGGLLLFAPGVAWYVGLSGVLHGLFAAGAVLAWRGGRRTALPLLGLLAGKLALEQGGGAGAVPWLEGTVIVEAHLYGALAGVIGALWLAARRAGGGRRPAAGAG